MTDRGHAVEPPRPSHPAQRAGAAIEFSIRCGLIGVRREIAPPAPGMGEGSDQQARVRAPRPLRGRGRQIPQSYWVSPPAAVLNDSSNPSLGWRLSSSCQLMDRDVLRSLVSVSAGPVGITNRAWRSRRRWSLPSGPYPVVELTVVVTISLHGLCEVDGGPGLVAVRKRQWSCSRARRDSETRALHAADLPLARMR